MQKYLIFIILGGWIIKFVVIRPCDINIRVIDSSPVRKFTGKHLLMFKSRPRSLKNSEKFLIKWNYIYKLEFYRKTFKKILKCVWKSVKSERNRWTFVRSLPGRIELNFQWQNASLAKQQPILGLHTMGSKSNWS